MKWKIADAHCDTLFSVGVGNRDPQTCQVTAQRLKDGNVCLQTLAMFAGGRGPAGEPYKKAVAMMENRHKVGVKIYEGLLPDEMPEAPGAVISIEGGEILEGSITRLDEIHSQVHLRLIALTWNNENEIAYPSAQDGPGLKPFGLHLLREMDARGICSDVSHLSEKGFWDVIDHASLPPVASHSNYKPLCNIHRNLTKDQVKAIIEKNGFIGLNFYTHFLVEQGEATLDDCLRHMDAIMELGGEDVLGFGSDFDGIESWPEGLNDPSYLPSFCDLLVRHGYTEQQVAKIAGGNYWRVLKQAEAAATIK